jgi:serine/threonine protein kinase
MRMAWAWNRHFEPILVVNPIFCGNCGANNPDNNSFCIKCGNPISRLSDQLTSAADPQNVPADGFHDPLDGIATFVSLNLTPETLLIVRFRIKKLLGSGGMGRVDMAQDELLKRPVAIKVIKEMLMHDEGARQRLLTEARASTSLAHPNIVRVHDVHDSGLVQFLVMEYVEGETLLQRIGREGRLSDIRSG